MTSDERRDTTRHEIRECDAVVGVTTPDQVGVELSISTRTHARLSGHHQRAMSKMVFRVLLGASIFRALATCCLRTANRLVLLVFFDDSDQRGKALGESIQRPVPLCGTLL